MFAARNMMFTSAGAELWTPANMTTAAWYDADDAATITESAGAVSQWDDKSGNSVHCVQASPSQKPLTGSATINSTNALSFDGTNDYLEKLSESLMDKVELSVFAVVQPIAGGDNFQGIITNSSTTAANRSDLTYYKASGYMAYVRPGSSSALASSNVTDVPMVLAGVGSISGANTTSEIWLDGTAGTTQTQTSGFTATENLVYIGFLNGTRYFKGYIGEIVVMRSTASATDRQRIEGYLAHKWSLEANLPSGHPFKSAAPTI